MYGDRFTFPAHEFYVAASSDFFCEHVDKDRVTSGKRHSFPREKNKQNKLSSCCVRLWNGFFFLWVMVIMRCSHTVPGIPLDGRPFPR